MLGLLGAAIFGVVAYGAWASDDNAEKRRRQSGKDNHCRYYVDKHGILRDVHTGKKYDGKDDNILLIQHKWNLYNLYVEFCMKSRREPKKLKDWLIQEGYNYELEYLYEMMMKYKNESWGDKYDRA